MSRFKFTRLLVVTSGVATLFTLAACQTAFAALADPLNTADGYVDSANHGYVLSAVSPAVTSIVGTGTQHSPGDDGEVDVNIGFGFTFFNNSYSDIQLNGNGHVYLGTGYNPEGNYLPGGNGNSAHPEDNGGVIHLNYGGPRVDFYWDDLDSGTGGAVYSETRGTAGSREFVVEFDQVPPFANDLLTSVQMIFHEGSNDITFNYIDVNGFGNARNGLAIGIQGDNTRYLQYGWFPGSGAPLSGFGIPDSGESLLFTAPLLPPTLQVFLDRDTGAVTVQNNTGVDQAIKGYSIVSAAGAFDETEFTSLADAGTDGWIQFTQDGAGTDLSEGHLTTGTIADGASISLGNAWAKYYEDENDLTFEYLDGNGDTVLGLLEVSGNDGQPYPFADLNFDNVINIDDWSTFKANFDTESPITTAAGTYRFSDLNEDGTKDVLDFAAFRTAYEAANGAGSFAAMLASVPEPSTFALFGIAGALLVGARRRSLKSVCSIVAAALVSLSFTSSAVAQPLLLEDFEGLTLIDSPLASDNDDETDWNSVADSGLGALGWTMDPRTTPVAPSNDEYYGWTVWDHTWWLNQQGNQAGRNQFLPGLQPNNTMLGVDPDAHDDFIDVDDDRFTTVVRSPELNISGLSANSLALTFNSTWAEEDLQLAVGRYVIDGTPTEFMRYDSAAGDPAFFKPTTAVTLNETIVVQIQNPAGASTLQIEWDMPRAGNDWWWGIDNVQVIGLPTLQANTTTGALTLVGGSAPAFTAYEVTSDSGSLDPTTWVTDNLDSRNFGGDGGDPLEADFNVDGAVDGDDFLLWQNGFGIQADAVKMDGDYNNDGKVDGDDFLGWQAEFGEQGGTPGPGESWETVGALDNQLIEAFLLGETEFAPGTETSLGTGFVVGGTQDLGFRVTTASGSVLSGLVEYVSGGGGATAVPEPGTLGLAGLLLAGLTMGLFRRRKGGPGMRCIKSFLLPAVAVALLMTSVTVASSTDDRLYNMGEDDGASAGGSVLTTKDAAAMFPGLGGDDQNLGSFLVNQTYVDVGPTGLGRPGAASGALGIEFDAGDADFIKGDRLGLPDTSAASVNGDPISGPLDYFGIVDRGFQLWVRPGSVGPTQQDIVMDTNQHGFGLTAGGDWFMQYAGLQVDSGVAAVVDTWYHVMVVRPSGAAGGASMFVDGNVVAAAPGDYDGGDNSLLVLGANTGDDVTAGQSNYFDGVLDELKMFVMGTSSPPPPSPPTEYGTFSAIEDNDFIAAALAGRDPADVNLDGDVNMLDVNDFVDNWFINNDVNGVTIGDLSSRARGDLDVNGLINLADWAILNAANPSMGAAAMRAITGVPEPSTMVLFALAVAGLALRRRR